VLNGGEETVGVAVWVAVDVGVGVCAEAVGVGVWANIVAAGVCVLAGVPVALGVGSWASAAPPITAAYRPAQQREMARIFLSDKTGLLHTRGAMPERARLRSTSASGRPCLSSDELACEIGLWTNPRLDG
jgi:hypothetical protein